MYTASLGAEHPTTQEAGRVYDEWAKIHPNEKLEAVVIDDDVAKELNKSSSRAICEHCKCIEKEANCFQRCARCNLAAYCSRDCQKADWKEHKTKCKEIAAVTERLEADRPMQRLKNKESEVAQTAVACVGVG